MSPSSIENDLQEVADDMFDSIGNHRVIVEAATLDELDRKPSDEVDAADVSISVADTEQMDNTHPYLMRYADIYAHSQEFSDPDEAIKAGNTKFIKISRSSDQGDFKKGEVVIYLDKETNTSHEATIVDVHYDERNKPHYDLMFKSGNNENSDAKEDTVRLSVKDGIKQVEAVSGTGTLNETNAVKCVNFDINPTPLFVAMYNGDWGAAQKRLESYPEEASVWVARYNTNRDDSQVFRWRLLPLHLCVALSGSNDDDNYIYDEAAPPDVPDDEQDEKLEQKENEIQTPPRTLLVALLKAYPQGTQYTDDQNLIPLHSAIRGNASLNVVEELLQVDPASVHCKDSRGRNALVLAKKVFQKRSSDSNARQIKYERLKALLLMAGTHSDAKLKEEQLHYETRINQLEEQNLSLRRDNALLRTRCERYEDLLEKLVQKLQEYQQKLDDNSSAGADAHGEANVDVLKEFSRMESIPPPPPASKPPPMDDDIVENWKVAFDAKKCKEYYFNKKTRVVTWVKPKCLEENEEEPVHSEDNGGDKEEVVDEAKKPENKVIGGRGAYAKRIERHIQTAMSYEKIEDVPATPTSTKTGVTEMSTPETWEGRNLSLELESFDEADVANKPFMADLSDISSGEIVQDISASTIFRLSSHTDKDSVPFDMANSTVSFPNAGAFTYSDMVKVGNVEKEASENAQEKKRTKTKVTFKDVPSVPKKKKPVNPAVSAGIERLRKKFEES